MEIEKHVVQDPIVEVSLIQNVGGADYMKRASDCPICENVVLDQSQVWAGFQPWADQGQGTAAHAKALPRQRPD